MWPILRVRDEVLYKRGTSKGALLNNWQLVVPPVLRRQVMLHLHSRRIAGHMGEKRTLSSIRQRFWWPFMRGDVARWCRVCDPCQRRKARPGPKHALLQQDPVGAPMEWICVDILTFSDVTENGNCCVLVISDSFSKWTEAFALPDHQALTVADVLVTEVFLRFGVPRIIHSDQGPEFQSNLLNSVCQLLEVKKTRTTPYHPQSDGQVERFNRTLIAMLSKLCTENKDWDDHLPYVMCAYRSTVNTSTGCSPNMIMLGREINLPIDLMYPRAEEDEYQCPIEYVEWVRQALRENFERARHCLGEAAQRQKRYYDQRAFSRKLAPGDWVLRFYPPELSHSKLNFLYTGPFLVTRKVGEVNYEIQRTEHSPKFVVHVDHLKPYEWDDVPPSWLPDLRNASTHIPEGGDESTPIPSHSSEHPTIPGTSGESPELPRRSERPRKLPVRFKDFVME